VLVLGIAASALIARTVTKRGLQPLSALADSLKQIGPNRLHERLGAGSWPRELQPVARAFDEMLDRLEDSFTRLSQFSADLAHELRTPIGNLRGEAEVALTRLRSPDEYREVIESSVAECERLSGIIDNLLFLARAEAAEGHIARTRFDGRAAIEKIAAYYEAISEDRNIAITCTGGGEIDADPVLFSRALTNLVDNALRFTPDGGKVALAVSVSDSAAEISVSDTGSGIAAEHVPRVFDRFYRADSSRSSMGTGLGLALVKSIADLHGGTATVQSELGRGTVVTLVLQPEARSNAQSERLFLNGRVT
jgi:two-component system heavy metal sensor histidine kinase CusS